MKIKIPKKNYFLLPNMTKRRLTPFPYKRRIVSRRKKTRSRNYLKKVSSRYPARSSISTGILKAGTGIIRFGAPIAAKAGKGIYTFSAPKIKKAGSIVFARSRTVAGKAVPQLQKHEGIRSLAKEAKEQKNTVVYGRSGF